MKQVIVLFIAFFVVLGGCSVEAEVDSETGDLTSLEYSVPLLDQYRSVLPNGNLLTVTLPADSEESDTTTTERLAALEIDAVGDPAFVPGLAVPMARAINGVIADLLNTMELVVARQPTAWNSETLEFVWGPWDNEDSGLEGDTVMVYIRDQGEGEVDFRFVYALLRGVGTDLSTMQPVIWGGANPDPENDNFGNGVLLWDFEANREWEIRNDPEKTFNESGRFAAVYSRGADEENADAVVTWVVASFRNLITEEGEDPATLDYLYGGITNGEERIDFADFNMVTDIDNIATRDGLENLGLRMAFYNHGTGRAEIDAVGGDIEAGRYVEGTECWDSDVNRTYLTLDVYSESGGDPFSLIGPIGSPDDCAMADLDGIPTLEDVDSELLAALDDAATNGLPEE